MPTRIPRCSHAWIWPLGQLRTGPRKPRRTAISHVRYSRGTARTTPFILLGCSIVRTSEILVHCQELGRLAWEVKVVVHLINEKFKSC
jgi:hypothetical protein